MKKAASPLLIALLGFASNTFAHSMFIMPASFHVEAGKVLSFSVNSTDVFPDSDFADTNLSVLTLHAGAKTAESKLTEDQKRMVGEATITTSGYLFATTSTATAVLPIEAKDFNDYIKEESLKHVIEWRERTGETDKPATERYTKYAKTLLLSGQPDDHFDDVLGMPIEFVLEKDPTLAKVGDVLPVQVLFEGKPAADLDITGFWLDAKGAHREIVAHTDADGRAKVTLSAAGAWNLHTIHMEHSSDAGVDWDSHWATVTFEVPAK